MKRFQQGETVDFLIVGAGAAGGVMAQELSQAGFSVLVLEQGPRLRPDDFEHGEFDIRMLAGLVIKIVVESHLSCLLIVVDCARMPMPDGASPMICACLKSVQQALGVMADGVSSADGRPGSVAPADRA